jgi:spermidine/putrescine transport system substrate-binding protein
MNQPTPMDPAFLRGLTQRRLSRRNALRISGLSAAAMTLAACGVKGSGGASTPTTPAPDAVQKYWAGKTKHGTLNFANWPLYMDPKKPELAKFTQETGIKVTYKEVIQDMGPWFAKVQPQLAAHQSIGYDLMVITDGIEFKQFVQGGYLAPLDHSKLPNYSLNAGAKYKTEAYDPGNVYSVPWASGMTGIAWDPDKIKDPISGMADLWNPKYKGKIGMMQDSQELGNFAMIALGISPEKSTPDDWRKAADKLRAQKDLVRKYYDQSYIDALGSGEVWITQAWSGDILQKNTSDNRNLQFIIPSEGGTIWTDNFAIPSTADNPVDAIMCIDFFYRPEIAASLAEYIGYVTPVPAAKAIMQSDAAKAGPDDKAYFEAVANSPLVFPDDATLGKLHYYREFDTAAERQQYQDTFQPIVLS